MTKICAWCGISFLIEIPDMFSSKQTVATLRQAPADSICHFRFSDRLSKH